MARRPKQQTLLDIALAGSWKVSALLAAIISFVIFVFIPTITNPIFKAVAQGAKPLALLLIASFGLIAAVKFIRQKLNGNKFSTVEIKHTEQPPSANSTSTPRLDRLDQELDAMLLRRQSTPVQQKPEKWSLKVIQDIEWKKFEELSTHYYLERGVRAESTTLGADGGIDIKLYQDGSGNPTAIVQCKAWNTRLVGVKPIREFLGVMSHEKIAKGFYMASGDYTEEAKEIAKANQITLINGEMLLMMIQRLPEDAQSRLLALATDGEYATPTCPTCGIKMVKRSSKRGDFWGCGNYPRCRQMLHMRTWQK